MVELIGTRQKEFLQLLLRNKAGLTVEDFSADIGITRNAVRQHLAVLEKEHLVAKGITRPSGGRPEQLYILTDKGEDIFPRHYSWFAQMLIEMLEQEIGEEEMSTRLSAAGEKIAGKLRGNNDATESLPIKIRKMMTIMDDLGYNINPRPPANIKGIPVIEADNCVFHDLAKKQPLVCRFDLALLATFTDSTVVHEECMAKGGNVCRFRFDKKDSGQL
jgi:predicted ArsR family transcriptional regulator